MNTFISTLVKKLKLAPSHQEEQSPIHDYIQKALKEDSSNNSITNEEIPNTPFRLIGQKDGAYFITMGKARLTPEYTNAKDAIRYLNDNEWTVIANMILAMPMIVEEAAKQQIEKEKKSN